MIPYPLIIFDLDGTLVNSIKRIVTSLQFASYQGVGVVLDETQAKSVIGLGLNEAISQLHPTLADKKNITKIERICQLYRHHYLHENTIAAPLYHQVGELLQGLSERGHQLAIATGKSRIGLDSALAEHQISHFFAGTRSSDDSFSKPHPQMLQQILHELNFAPDQALMIGDSQYDLAMANSAKVASIGITHGVDDELTLKAYNPIACLHNIQDLVNYFNNTIYTTSS